MAKTVPEAASQRRAGAAFRDIEARFAAARKAFEAMERAHQDGRFLGPESAEFTRRLRAVVTSAHRAGNVFHELRRRP